MSKNKRGPGAGTIRKRKDGRWEAALTIGYTDAGNPKRHTKYAKTRRKAEELLAELQVQYAKGTLVEISSLDVRTWLDQWLASKTHLAEKTRNDYEYEITHVKELLGDIKLQALKPAQVRYTYTAIAQRGISIRTQKKAAMHLRSALKEAVDLELLSRNPAEGVKIRTPRVASTVNPWNREEVPVFLKVARDDLSYPLFFLILATGLRRGEALGLLWRNVDLNDGIIRITQTLSGKGKGSSTILKEVKTPRARRTLRVGRDVVEILYQQAQQQAAYKATLGAAWEDSGLVFTTSLGTKLLPRNVYRSFKRLIAKAGVSDISIHDLRHTYASLALQRGMPVELVSERLGHASVGFTLDTYRHLYESERAKGALELNDLLGFDDDED